jgi:integrase
LYAGTTKNDDGRVFPLINDLKVLLEKQYANTQKIIREKKIVCPWVFHRNGKPIRSFYKAWKHACHAAGLPCTIHLKRDSVGQVVHYKQGKKKGQPIIERIEAENILHDFRRTAVRNLVRLGIPERVAMLMTGHKTRSVFERYNIVSPGDLSEAARKLNLSTGTVSGTVAPVLVHSTVLDSANLLQSQHGPVAQKDRAAVS